MYFLWVVLPPVNIVNNDKKKFALNQCGRFAHWDDNYTLSYHEQKSNYENHILSYHEQKSNYQSNNQQNP